jgi:hypothetical protein
MSEGKDFMDFVSDAKDDQALLEKFKKELAKDDVSVENILNYFYNQGYTGVTARDCETILATKENIDGDMQIKY